MAPFSLSRAKRHSLNVAYVRWSAVRCLCVSNLISLKQREYKRNRILTAASLKRKWRRSWISRLYAVRYVHFLFWLGRWTGGWMDHERGKLALSLSLSFHVRILTISGCDRIPELENRNSLQKRPPLLPSSPLFNVVGGGGGEFSWEWQLRSTSCCSVIQPLNCPALCNPLLTPTHTYVAGRTEHNFFFFFSIFFFFLNDFLFNRILMGLSLKHFGRTLTCFCVVATDRGEMVLSLSA